MSKLKTRRKKAIIDTRIRVQTSTSSTAEFEAPPAECSMHAPAHAVVWHSIDPALHAVLPRHRLGCLKAFLLGWRMVLLSTSWSGVKWLNNEADKRHYKSMFGGGRRRSPQACVRQGRCQKTPTLTLLAEVLTASPAWGFFSLETMYFELLFEVLALTFRSTCETGGCC